MVFNNHQLKIPDKMFKKRLFNKYRRMVNFLQYFIYCEKGLQFQKITCLIRRCHTFGAPSAADGVFIVENAGITSCEARASHSREFAILVRLYRCLLYFFVDSKNCILTDEHIFQNPMVNKHILNDIYYGIRIYLWLTK